MENPRTVNSVTISSRQVGNDTLYSDNLKKHYLNPIYVTNVIIKGFPGKKDRITIPAISSVDKLRGCINIYIPSIMIALESLLAVLLTVTNFKG